MVETLVMFTMMCVFLILFIGLVKIGAMLLKHMPIRLIKGIAVKVNTAIKW